MLGADVAAVRTRLQGRCALLSWRPHAAFPSVARARRQLPLDAVRLALPTRLRSFATCSPGTGSAVRRVAAALICGARDYTALHALPSLLARVASAERRSLAPEPDGTRPLANADVAAFRASQDERAGAWWLLDTRRASDLLAMADDVAASAAVLSAAEALRAEGNRAMNEKRYSDAIARYTHALAAGAALSPTLCATLLSNRSAAHAALGAFRDALRDADDALAADANFLKVHLRRANALLSLAVTECDGRLLDDACKTLMDAADAAGAAGDAPKQQEFKRRSKLVWMRLQRLTIKMSADSAVCLAEEQLKLSKQLGDRIAAAEAAAILALYAEKGDAPETDRLVAVRSHASDCMAQLEAAARDTPVLAAGTHAKTLEAVCKMRLGMALLACREPGAVDLLSTAAALVETPGVPAASSPVTLGRPVVYSYLCEALCEAGAPQAAEAVLAKLEALDAVAWPDPMPVLRRALCRSNIADAREDAPAVRLGAMRAIVVACEELLQGQPHVQEQVITTLSNMSNLLDAYPSVGGGAAEAAAIRRRLYGLLHKEPSSECSICLEPISPFEASLDGDGLTTLRCWHVFHTRCVDTWLTSIPGRGCPTCRDFDVSGRLCRDWSAQQPQHREQPPELSAEAVAGAQRRALRLVREQPPRDQVMAPETQSALLRLESCPEGPFFWVGALTGPVVTSVAVTVVQHPDAAGGDEPHRFVEVEPSPGASLDDLGFYFSTAAVGDAVFAFGLRNSSAPRDATGPLLCVEGVRDATDPRLPPPRVQRVPARGRGPNYRIFPTMFCADGCIYVLGGAADVVESDDVGFLSLWDAWRFVPEVATRPTAGGEWQRLELSGDCPSSAPGFAPGLFAAVHVLLPRAAGSDSHVLLVGGQSNHEQAFSREVYDINLNTGAVRCLAPQPGGRLPRPRCFAMAVLLPRCVVTGALRVLFFGGRTADTDLNDAWTWDVDAHAWSEVDAAELQPMVPRVLTHSGPVMLLDGEPARLLLWGGRHMSGEEPDSSGQRLPLFASAVNVLRVEPLLVESETARAT